MTLLGGFFPVAYRRIKLDNHIGAPRIDIAYTELRRCIASSRGSLRPRQRPLHVACRTGADLIAPPEASLRLGVILFCRREIPH